MKLTPYTSPKRGIDRLVLLDAIEPGKAAAHHSRGIVVTIAGKIADGHLGAQYETVDVLQDPEIRQGIKDYSEWPTIPQLYVRGEFVGGSDIMMEMFESGELQQLIAAEA